MSLTFYKVLTTTQPPYVYNLISVQCHCNIGSSSVVSLARPPTYSLKIADRFFRYASPGLWNQLRMSLRQPHSGASFSIPDSSIPAPITSSFNSPLCSSITPPLFHSRLKTYLFHKFLLPVISLLLPHRLAYHPDCFF